MYSKNNNHLELMSSIWKKSLNLEKVIEHKFMPNLQSHVLGGTSFLLKVCSLPTALPTIMVSSELRCSLIATDVSWWSFCISKKMKTINHLAFIQVSSSGYYVPVLQIKSVSFVKMYLEA